MEEEAEGEFGHGSVLGKGEGFTDQAAEALAQGVVEALDVIGTAALGVSSLVLGWR